jgi:hypothetical protein
LEDRIRELCDKLISAEDGSPEFEIAASNLRTALSEHVKRIRAKFRDYPLTSDRRSKKE